MPSNRVWDVEDLKEHLKTEIESREVCARMVSSISDTFEESFAISDGEELAPASTMHSGGRRTDNITCTYCRGAHPSAKCQVVTDPKERKAILFKKSKCFICLKGAHKAQQCNSGKKCFNCGNKHHISICEQPKK